uniref:Uncharacterized protein n=1 Tax=Rhodnius prolixus TaxID=13249 RepID=T1H8T6_RHOPR
MVPLYLVLFALASIVGSVPYKLGNEYQFELTTLLNDGSKSFIGYQIKSELILEQLVKELFLIKNYGFIPHKSNIDNYNNDPFLVELSEGKVSKMFVSEKDDKGIINIKKAISNLFQVWGGKVLSKRKDDIFLENEKIISITSWEEHVSSPNLSELLKINVSTKVEIKLTGMETLKEKYPSEDIKSVMTKVEAEQGKIFEIYSLEPQKIDDESVNYPRFAKVISANAEFLENRYLGSSKSAAVFIEAVKAARRSSLQDIFNVINSKRNTKILPQLMDILGAAQTVNTHKAAFKLLKINTEKYDLNLCERYFWALSMAPTIQPHILEELQLLIKNQHKSNKLWYTIVLTMASAVNKFARDQEHSDEIVAQTVDLLRNFVKRCNGNEQCEEIYIKALSNIHSEKSISVLLEIVDTASKKSVARALKGISKITPKFWNNDVIKVAEEVLLSNRTYDSSARIFALDLLLLSNPSLALSSRIVSILKQTDKSRELKEYLLQRLDEFPEKKQIYSKNLCNNYDALAQGGLSTTFSRTFMPNGTLSTSQEIVGGILKQGHVDVNLLYNGKLENPFVLGIFAGGLSSFVSSDEENSGDDETSTAGLELSVLGVDLRPFVFFNGTGELMGHVWSGTASSLTPAYQALLLLEDNTVLIPLNIGEVLTLRLESAVSADLSGEIEISLWNRNAQSLVKNRAGILLRNVVSINAPYFEANLSADLNIEPELNLSSDLDFSNGASLCLQLYQPKIFVNGKIQNWGRITDTKKIAKRILNLDLPIEGKSYSLNSKNDEMCKKVFS